MLWVRSSSPPAVAVQPPRSPHPAAPTTRRSCTASQGMGSWKRQVPRPLLGPHRDADRPWVRWEAWDGKGWDGEVGEERQNTGGKGRLRPHQESGTGVQQRARQVCYLPYAWVCVQAGKSRGSSWQRPRTVEREGTCRGNVWPRWSRVPIPSSQPAKAHSPAHRMDKS